MSNDERDDFEARIKALEAKSEKDWQEFRREKRGYLEQTQDNATEINRLRSMLTEAQRLHEKKTAEVEVLTNRLDAATKQAITINFDCIEDTFKVTLFGKQMLRFEKPKNIVGNLTNWLATLRRLHATVAVLPTAPLDDPGTPAPKCRCNETDERDRSRRLDCPIHG